MEKIKDALSKAKVRRSSQVRQPLDEVKPANNKFTQIDDELKSIVYSDTSVVQLDPVHLENNRIVAQNDSNPASWIFDTLRTQVLQKMEENNWRTVAIISPTPASGKSFVSINLAISIAKQPQKSVMLVDFDLRRPRIAQYLGLNQEKSFNDFLNGEAKLSDIIVNPSIPQLTVIPTNKPVKKSSESLSSSRIKNLIVELKERYDSRIVIFDLPPILNADDAMVLLPQVDCVLLVVGNGLHTESEISETMRLLSRYNILGVVVNKAEVEQRNYYY